MRTFIPYCNVGVAPPPVHRGGDANNPPAPRKFRVQSGTLTCAWGSEPGSANLVYVTNETPCAIGAPLTIQCAGHTFYGVCVYDEPYLSSKGRKRELKFCDNRFWLDCDRAYCAFNQPDDRVVSGHRQKRYAHILPYNYNTLKKTYTTTPYSARQIIGFLIKAPTTEDLWRCVFHREQADPLPVQFDFLNGPTLRAALQAVSDPQGLCFTLQGGAFRLVWARKGEGIAPVAPQDSDDRTTGLSLSGHPTRIRVLGDRNLYQIHNIPMVRGWSVAWEQYFDEILFFERIYAAGVTIEEVTLSRCNKTHTFPAGTAFATIGRYKQDGLELDPDQITARQMARAAALQMTVGEFAALDGAQFADTRKFATRSRMDMPAVLYIRQILFRAFDFPAGFTITNVAGLQIPLNSLEIAGKMVAKVTHDPVTGLMEWDAAENADGNGYAVIQGYEIGKDLFRTIRPERFDIDMWNNSQNVWEHHEFQVDDSGEEGGRYILFDTPIIKSSNIVQMVNGYAVVKAHPTIDVPAVRVAVTFQGERFSYIKGKGSRDDCESVPGLNAEYVGAYGVSGLEEIAYADGELATVKADTIADSLLNRQYVYAKGSFTRWITPESDGTFAAGTELTGKIDRVTVEFSPSGCSEKVELTSEWPRQNYVPERDLDRGARMKQLLPGQAELRHEANLARMTAAAAEKSPETRKLMRDAFHGNVGGGSGNRPVNIQIAPTDGDAEETLVVGSVIRKKPNEIVHECDGDYPRHENTQGVVPSSSTAAHTEFVGVTIRQDEIVGGQGGELVLNSTGDLLAQVKGPVKVGDAVGMVDGQYYLSPAASASVGKSLQAITDATINLIKVRTTSAQATSGSFPFQIVKVTETTVKVNTGWMLKGFDARAQQVVSGLNTTFSVLHNNDIIYLETMFDKEGDPFLCNVCIQPTWDADVFPKMTRAIRATDAANIATAFWVADKNVATNTALVQTEYERFDSKRRHWKTFTQIGFCVKGIVDGAIQLTIDDELVSVVQSLDTNLMLWEGCEQGIPVRVPIPYAQAIVEKIVLLIDDPGDTVTMLAVDHPDAEIYYTVDGSTPTAGSTRYSAPFTAPDVDGPTVITGIAIELGFYSGTATLTVP